MSAKALAAGSAPSTIQPAVSAEIQQYFDQNILFKDRILHSFSMKQAVGEKDTVDCIQDNSPPPAVPPSPPTTAPPSSLPPVPGLLSNTAQDGTLDPFGRIRACPVGTFAQVRPSIFELAPYKTVAEWKRAVANMYAPFSVQVPGHDHVSAGQYINNWGMSSDISFESPLLNYRGIDPYPSSEFSNQQLWLYGHYHEPGQPPNSDQQTIETGWGKATVGSPIVRVFASANAYNTYCFDAQCEDYGVIHWRSLPGFTFYAPVPVAPPGSVPNHGIFGIYGSRTDGNWYVYIINQWAGYFYFDSGPLSRTNLMSGTAPASFVAVGGEVFEGAQGNIPPGTIHPYIQMGMGNFPSLYSTDYNNMFHNAFAACNFYLDGTGTWRVGSPATAILRGGMWNWTLWVGPDRPDCYNGQVINNYQPPTTTPYLLLGGPGPNGSACTTY